jgi:hypothetical protein
MNGTLERELREQLDQLPPDQQRQVLDFARALLEGAGNPFGSGAEPICWGYHEEGSAIDGAGDRRGTEPSALDTYDASRYSRS